MSELSRRKENSCTCYWCQNMCKTSPCFPTPAEAKKIVDAGYYDRMYSSTYFDIHTGEQFDAIAPLATKHGCTFFKDGRCELHDQHLKPLEGRLATHSRADSGLRKEVCKLWDSKAGEKMFKYWDKRKVSNSATPRCGIEI